MGYPDFAAGQRLTAQNLIDMQWHSVEQGSDQTLNSTTTLTDTNLTVTLVAGATYMFRCLVGLDTGGTPDAVFAWTAPTNGEVIRFTAGFGAGGSGTQAGFSEVNFRRPQTTTEVQVDGSGSGNVHAYYEWGVFDGGDGGAATLQFAQDVSSATDTRILASSRLDYLRIS